LHRSLCRKAESRRTANGCHQRNIFVSLCEPKNSNGFDTAPLLRYTPPMTDQQEHEHGGEYQPDPFGAPGSLDDIRSEGPAVGCLLLYVFAAIVFAAEMLRYFTGSAKWWPLLIAIPFLLPRGWAALRLWQSPQLIEGEAVRHASLKDRRWYIVATMLLLFVELEFQLFWPVIKGWFEGW
jgi:hypothetical protein